MRCDLSENLFFSRSFICFMKSRAWPHGSVEVTKSSETSSEEIVRHGINQK